MAQAPVGEVLWKVPAVAAASILGTVTLGLLTVGRFYDDQRSRAAALITASWGNVTYLGIPVLTATVGNAQTLVALLFDFAASTPLLWTVGVLLAAGGHRIEWRQLLHVPPLWAAALGLGLRCADVPLPAAIDTLCALAAAPVVPLMMVVLGLSLRWEYLRQWRQVLPIAALKLVAAPCIALAATAALGLDGTTRVAAVLEAAMPTMMLTLVLGERYGLPTERVAAAIALTTVGSSVTLPLWWGVLTLLG